MDTELKLILTEIEEIIAKIGNYDIGKSKLSHRGRKELVLLFKEKLLQAKLVHNNYELKLVG